MKDFTESVREIARSLIRQYLPSNRNIDFGDNCRSEEIANKVKSEIAKRLPKEKGHNLEDRNLIVAEKIGYNQAISDVKKALGVE